MAPETGIDVEVVYALADEQIVVPLRVPAGTSARDAVRLSGLGDRYSTIASGACVLGIYGRIVKGETVLSPGDRVEIYRGLVADPKQARRRRARARG